MATGMGSTIPGGKRATREMIWRYNRPEWRQPIAWMPGCYARVVGCVACTAMLATAFQPFGILSHGSNSSATYRPRKCLGGLAGRCDAIAAPATLAAYEPGAMLWPRRLTWANANSRRSPAMLSARPAEYRSGPDPPSCPGSLAAGP